ncbi:MAG: hypothetical protein R3F59_30970 [Myxococcota bacterium]
MLAGRVARGEVKSKKVIKELQALAKRPNLVHGPVSMWWTAVPPGQPVDVSSVSVPSNAKQLAVGSAMGDLGGKNGSFGYAVVLVMMVAGT